MPSTAQLSADSCSGDCRIFSQIHIALLPGRNLNSGINIYAFTAIHRHNHFTGTLVSTIQVPGLLFIFGVLSRPWSLIGNLVADPRLCRFDSRWPQTLMRCAACAALSYRQCGPKAKTKAKS